MATKLTVTTPQGTFTRKTVRTYTHLVVVAGERFELVEADRLARLAHSCRLARRYATLKNSDGRPLESRWLDRAADWAAAEAKQAAHLANQAPVTTDQGTPGVLGWCGRLDLAVALARTPQALRYRTVTIYTVDGQLVATVTNGPAPSPREVAVAAARGELSCR